VLHQHILENFNVKSSNYSISTNRSCLMLIPPIFAQDISLTTKIPSFQIITLSFSNLPQLIILTYNAYRTRVEERVIINYEF